MVKFNILGIAKKLAQAYQINPAKVDNFWKGLSGNPAELKKMVSQGSKQQISGLGSVAATVTATATPIVIKVMSLLKSLGIKDPAALLQKGAKAGIKALANKKGKDVKFEEKEVPENQAEETQVSVEKTIPTPSETPTSEETNNREVETESSNVRTANKLPLETVQVRDNVTENVPTKGGTENTTTSSETENTPASGGKNKMLIPLLIAGGIGAFFLFKKK
jgi:poly(3-hydroxybutyrate) depolymerase